MATKKLMLIGGGPGSGKTSLAYKVAERYGLEVVAGVFGSRQGGGIGWRSGGWERQSK